MHRRETAFGAAIWFMALSGWVPLAPAQQAPVTNMASSSHPSSASVSSVGSMSSTPSAGIAKSLAPYAVGSGDVLNVSVWQEKELSSVVTVRPDGNISLPLIGEVMVSGMTPLRVQLILEERLKSEVVSPRVTVTVMEIHSRMVYVTGEVTRPGAYPLNTPLDVLQLLAQAGGLTQFASRKNIRLLHADRSQADVVIDYSHLLKTGSSSNNPQLAPGDTVVVK